MGQKGDGAGRKKKKKKKKPQKPGSGGGGKDKKRGGYKGELTHAGIIGRLKEVGAATIA